MIVPAFQTFIALSVICVPLAWLAPQRLAFDVIAVWTLLCLGAMSPATAIWVGVIVLLLPSLFRFCGPRRGLATGLGCVLLIAFFVFSRVSAQITTFDWSWVGGAFFTLRALHILLDWWMGKIDRLSYSDCARYFFFLPTLAAGPINRLAHFQHQLRRRRWDKPMFFTGAERLLLGLVWFYVVAGWICDELETLAQAPLSSLPSFFDQWGMSALYWVELFFAFSGTSHIALGVCLMIGLKLEENFNRPWAANGLIEFWTRWHMTLTNWVRDYVFVPVSALTRSPVLALCLAMLVVGLWHEFSTYYVLWSFWQSLGIIFARVLGGRVTMSLPKPLGPLMVLAWLSAAQPVIGLLGINL